MKEALISPNEVAYAIVGWENFYTPIYGEIPNACRVAEVATSPFDVCPPFFWAPCQDTDTADTCYWDKTTDTVKPNPPAPPRPSPADQPVVTGAQTL